MPIDLNALIEQTARKYGVPVRIAQNLAIAESAMNPNAVSPAGAIGVMQLMPACVTTDTLCLTRSGWRRYDEISPGDDILTYSIERDCLEWQPVRAVFFYEHPGQLIHMHNQCFDFVVTPNHKWVVEERWKCQRTGQRSVVLRETQDLNSTSQNYIVRVAKYPFAKDATIPDAFVYLLGIVFADGFIDKDGHQVDLYQKDKVDKFRKALNDCGIVYREYLRSQDGVYRWNITGKDALAISQWLWQGGKKRLTMELLTSITEKQALLLWEALLDTDAYTSINGWESFSQNDLDCATDIQTLLFLMGKLSTVRKVHDPGKAVINGDTVYQALVNYRKTTPASNNRLRYEVVDEQPVWCPSVDNKTWVALRNGFITITGNTARSLGVDPYDPAQNIEGGIRYLRQMYDRFGSWPLAVAAYNAGPGAVEKYGGIPPYPETQTHVQKVLGGTEAEPVVQQPTKEHMLRQLIRVSRSPYTSNWVDALRNAQSIIQALREPTVWERLPEGMKTIAKLQQEETARHHQAMEEIYRQQMDIDRMRALFSAAGSTVPSTAAERAYAAEAEAYNKLLEAYRLKRTTPPTTLGELKAAGETGEYIAPYIAAYETLLGAVSDPRFSSGILGAGGSWYKIADNFTKTTLGIPLDQYITDLKKSAGENDPLVRILEAAAAQHYNMTIDEYRMLQKTTGGGQ